MSAVAASDAVPETATGRVCGESESRAPSVTTISTPSSSARPTISSQKPRQRMLGSSPRTSTTSRSPGSRAIDSRVVGHSMRRLLPSSRLTVGRLTWKS